MVTERPESGMVHYEPRTLMQLAEILGDVCRTLQADSGLPVSPEIKNTIAKHILESYDAGMADPSKLRADALAFVEFAS